MKFRKLFSGLQNKKIYNNSKRNINNKCFPHATKPLEEMSYLGNIKEQ